ncbi:hypothetical protein DVA86_18325 [Streptomyces armeniacus]|uniref:Uncharacterized protein n=1 Tax=Streptomyces armeniacus TaxID=83291 RepID=A0A345XRP8_9ACTN|nr:hypothetical protein [Streptomyces armeniacus]AXK34314.1 hypothetical protein DVA86_18325 [Streptomyces armeniacus]AZY92016.1 hypothetical protein [Streptomyces armeniacus]
MSRTPPEHALRRSLSATARLGAVPVAAVLAVLVSAPVAAPYAPAAPARPGGGDVEVTPGKARPGEWVDLRAGLCRKGETALAASDAFQRDVELEPAAAGDVAGSAQLRRNAGPGRYGITVDCQESGRTAAGKGAVTVLRREQAPQKPAGHNERNENPRNENPRNQNERRKPNEPEPPAPDRPEEPAVHHPQGHASPVAPVRAGGGATAGGPDTADGLGASGTAGLGLAAGAVVVGAVAHAVRRRRTDRTPTGR